MKRKRTLSESDIKEILELRDSGVPRNQVAKKFNVEDSILYLLENGKLYKDTLKKLGREHEPIRNAKEIRSAIRRQNRKLSEDDVIEIFAMVNKKTKNKEILEKFKISYALLNNILNNKAYNDIVQKHNLKRMR